MILVTGASGLVGLHLIQYLSTQAQKVRALYHSKIPDFLPNTIAANIEWAPCDVLDISELEKNFIGITHVYHCAAIISYDARMIEAMMEINIEGTANVVNVCLEKNIEKMSPPALAVQRDGSNVQISWPGAVEGWRLESSAEPSGAAWDLIAQNPTPVGGRWTVSLTEPTGRRFYRLVKP